MKSGAGWLASATPEKIEAFLSELSDNALLSLPWLFEFWALPHQLPPEGAWKTWVIMGGRGAGKTRAGAEWVRAEVEGATPKAPGRARRVALVGETVDQVREVMVFGESGILACSPPTDAPSGRRRGGGWSGRMEPWRRSFRRMTQPAFAARSSMRPGRMSWRSGPRARKLGINCSSLCGWASIPGRW